jgi:hypothetical protein
VKGPFKEDLSVGLGDTLELILLLDGVAVGGALSTEIYILVLWLFKKPAIK